MKKQPLSNNIFLRGQKELEREKKTKQTNKQKKNTQFTGYTIH